MIHEGQEQIEVFGLQADTSGKKDEEYWKDVSTQSRFTNHLFLAGQFPEIFPQIAVPATAEEW